MNENDLKLETNRKNTLLLHCNKTVKQKNRSKDPMSRKLSYSLEIQNDALMHREDKKGYPLSFIYTIYMVLAKFLYK